VIRNIDILSASSILVASFLFLSSFFHLIVLILFFSSPKKKTSALSLAAVIEIERIKLATRIFRNRKRNVGFSTNRVARIRSSVTVAVTFQATRLVENLTVTVTESV